MAFGNPFPLPRRAGNYAGQHIDGGVYALVPRDWSPQPDTVFPPERARTTVAHEMAHAFVFEINPGVKGWITEGIAKYEETAEFSDLVRTHGFASTIGESIEEGNIPKFSELFTRHQVTSSEITGDYLFAGSFVDFASVKYGFRNIAAFVRTNDFSASFGRTENENLGRMGSVPEGTLRDSMNEGLRTARPFSPRYRRGDCPAPSHFSSDSAIRYSTSLFDPLSMVRPPAG